MHALERQGSHVRLVAAREQQLCVRFQVLNDGRGGFRRRRRPRCRHLGFGSSVKMTMKDVIAAWLRNRRRQVRGVPNIATSKAHEATVADVERCFRQSIDATDRSSRQPRLEGLLGGCRSLLTGLILNLSKGFGIFIIAVTAVKEPS